MADDTDSTGMAGVTRHALLELLFPNACMLCGRPFRIGRANRPDIPGGRPPPLIGCGAGVCDSCAGTLPDGTAPACPSCGDRMGPGLPPEETCPACRSHPHVFSAAIALGRHEGGLRTLVHRMKFRPSPPAARFLGERLADIAIRDGRFRAAGLVTVVPTLWTRRLRRGCHPPEILAKAVAQRLDIPLRQRILALRRRVALQTRLSRAGRIENVTGAFAVRRPAAVRGRVVILVDDVLTTGATADACARALLHAGARDVLAAVAARAPYPAGVVSPGDAPSPTGDEAEISSPL
ncbi:MAG: ComF family protein [Planctomycetota bacterium]